SVVPLPGGCRCGHPDRADVLAECQHLRAQLFEHEPTEWRQTAMALHLMRGDAELEEAARGSMRRQGTDLVVRLRIGEHGEPEARGGNDHVHAGEEAVQRPTVVLPRRIEARRRVEGE